MDYCGLIQECLANNTWKKILDFTDFSASLKGDADVSADYFFLHRSLGKESHLKLKRRRRSLSLSFYLKIYLFVFKQVDRLKIISSYGLNLHPVFLICFINGAAAVIYTNSSSNPNDEKCFSSSSLYRSCGGNRQFIAFQISSAQPFPHMLRRDLPVICLALLSHCHTTKLLGSDQAPGRKG